MVDLGGGKGRDKDGKEQHVKMERRGYKKGRSYLSKPLVGMLVWLDLAPYHCSQFCVSFKLCS